MEYHDPWLYISIGDGAAGAAHADEPQKLRPYRGAILKYHTGKGRWEPAANGLRNPWTWTLHDDTLAVVLGGVLDDEVVWTDFFTGTIHYTDTETLETRTVEIDYMLTALLVDEGNCGWWPLTDESSHRSRELISRSPICFPRGCGRAVLWAFFSPLVSVPVSHGRSFHARSRTAVRYGQASLFHGIASFPGLACVVSVISVRAMGSNSQSRLSVPIL